MGEGYGLVGLASIVSGTAGSQVVAADTSMANTAVRIFDAILLDTATTVNFYSGTAVVAGNLRLVLDTSHPIFSSSEGLRFIGGVWAASGNTAVAGNIATISYIREF